MTDPDFFCFDICKQWRQVSEVDDNMLIIIQQKWATGGSRKNQNHTNPRLDFLGIIEVHAINHLECNHPDYQSNIMLRQFASPDNI